jgi:hypothetical protein
VIQKKTATLLTILSLLLLGAIIPWQQSVSGANAVAGSGGWETPSRLSTTSANVDPVLRAAPNGSLMVMYNHRLSSGARNPYYTYLLAGSDNWSSPAPVHVSSDNMVRATFAFDNNSTAHAVWRTAQAVQYAAQNQWPNQAETIVSTTDPNEIIKDPDIAIDSNNLPHVVWVQDRQIYHAYHTGGTWVITDLSTVDRLSESPSVTVDADRNVHIVWDERFAVPPPSRHEIHYKKGTWTGSGYNWDSSPTNLSAGIDLAHRPTITSEGNSLHVSFARQESDTEQYAYYTRFTPEYGWSAPVDTTNGSPVGVNTNSPFYLISAVAACNTGVFVYYHGTLTGGFESIWESRMSNSQGWANKVQVTDGNQRAINPSAVCVNGTVHLVYEVVVQIDSNHQIYYTKQKHLLYLPIIRR